MTVARILSGKGRDVITTQPHRTLREAAQILADKGIGAIVVTSADGSVLGILSERDIVRAIGRAGADGLQDPVSRHMTARVVTATEEASVLSLMGQMTEGRFRHVPIVRMGKLTGLISIGDVVKYRIAEIETEHRAMQDYITT